MCTAISAGTYMAIVSQAPGLSPAAVGSGGNESIATSGYRCSAPCLPVAWIAFTYAVSFDPAPDCRSGCSQHGSPLL